MEKKLSEFLIGEKGIIVRIDGNGRVRRRLLDMGVTPSAEIYLRKRAPLNDPVEVTLRNYELSLRKSEAELVFAEVEK